MVAVSVRTIDPIGSWPKLRHTCFPEVRSCAGARRVEQVFCCERSVVQQRHACANPSQEHEASAEKFQALPTCKGWSGRTANAVKWLAWAPWRLSSEAAVLVVLQRGQNRTRYSITSSASAS